MAVFLPSSPVGSFKRLAPLWIWLAIFWSQAHKEERFFFPAYVDTPRSWCHADVSPLQPSCPGQVTDCPQDTGLARQAVSEQD